MTEERTEEERATAAPLTVMVGGQPREIPVLTRRESRKWRAIIAERMGDLFTDFTDDEIRTRKGGLLGIGDEVLADIVLAFDQTDVLGGRDGLDDLTDRELYDVYQLMVTVTFPLDGFGLQEMHLRFGSVQSPKASSSNGHSRTGNSSRRKSTTSRPSS